MPGIALKIGSPKKEYWGLTGALPWDKSILDSTIPAEFHIGQCFYKDSDEVWRGKLG